MEEKKPTEAEVKVSRFGCNNCLWAGVECKNYEKMQPEYHKTLSGKVEASCKGYTYYD